MRFVLNSPQRPYLRRAQLGLVVLRREHIVGPGSLLRVGRPYGNPADRGDRLRRWCRHCHLRPIQHHRDPAFMGLLLLMVVVLLLLLLVLHRRSRRRWWWVVNVVVLSTFFCRVCWFFDFMFFFCVLWMSDINEMWSFSIVCCCWDRFAEEVWQQQKQNMDKTNE